MLKFDIFSMRVALGYLAGAVQVCLGDWFIEPKPKERKKIAYKIVFSNYFLDNQKIPVHIYHA